jgi:hypothetical protein
MGLPSATGGLRVDPCTVLPGEAGGGAGELEAQRVGQVDLAAAGGQLGPVAVADALELGAQCVTGGRGEERRPIAVALAPTHEELAAIEVDVLHAQGEGLHEAEAAAVEKLGDEAEGRIETVEERDDLATAEHGGEMLGALGALEAVEVGYGEVEDATVEEEEGTEGLVLGGGGGVALDGEMIEESGDLGGAEGAGVAAAVEGDEGADPVEVGLLGAGEPSWRRRKAARTASTRVIQTHRRERGESCREPREK